MNDSNLFHFFSRRETIQLGTAIRANSIEGETENVFAIPETTLCIHLRPFVRGSTLVRKIEVRIKYDGSK